VGRVGCAIIEVFIDHRGGSGSAHGRLTALIFYHANATFALRLSCKDRVANGAPRILHLIEDKTYEVNRPAAHMDMRRLLD
jgi:hypothetical protein